MRRAIFRIGARAVLAGLVGTGLALGVARADPPAPGQQVWVQRCQGCHEPAIGHAPDRAALAARSPQTIQDALTSGSMKAMAGGLSAEDIRAVADYLTKTPPPAAAQAATRAPVAVGRPTDQNLCASNPAIRPGPSDWPSLGLDEHSSRFQPRPGLRAADVPRLKLKWAFALSGGGQATVVGDWLFITNRDGKFYALDPRTGCIRWVVSGASSRTTPMIVRSTISPSGWATFISVQGTSVAAYDAQSGKPIWRSPKLETFPAALLTGSPVVAGERLFVPISSFEEVLAASPKYPCCSFRGSLAALDLKTGKPIWKTSVIDEPLTPSRRNSAGAQMQGPAGAAIWSAPTTDAKRGFVYVATGDSYTEVPTTGADAIVALYQETGKVRWKTQVTPADNYIVGCDGPPATHVANCPKPMGQDFDFGAPPVLRTLPGGRQVLVAGQKSGLVYGLDPDTGKRLWTTRVGTGSALGGIEWGMAADPKRIFGANADFVPLLLAGLHDAGKIPPSVPVPAAHPGLNALDPATGRILWQVPAPVAPCQYRGDRSRDFLPGVCFRAQSAAPSAMPGAVFSGTLDGWFRAYDAATGKILWAYSTTAQTYDTVNGVKDQPGGGIDSMGPTIAGGMVYQVSGYSGSSNTGGNPINVLLAFSMDGK